MARNPLGSPTKANATVSNRALGILFLVVFIDLLGFGILIPLVPFYVERLGVGPELITAVLALYSLAQFLVTPVWGHVSDRIGRRPVLILCMAGHVGAYVILAFADSLAMLILSRVLGGLTAGNLATAYAYVTDLTPAEERAKHLGKISGAFGLGFIVGPALGGLLAGTGDIADANFVRPALAAAGLSLTALVGIVCFLPESRGTVNAHNTSRGTPGRGHERGRGFGPALALVLSRPVISLMVLLCLTVITFAAVRESIFSLWMSHQFAYGPATIGMVFSFNGIILVIVQFTAIGPLTKRFGEYALLLVGMTMYTACWIGLIIAQGLIMIMISMAASAIGTALFATSLQSMLSRRAGEGQRGVVMGVFQSASSLGRFSGQTVAGTIYGQIGPNAPFLLGALAMIPAFIIAMRIGTRLKSSDEPQVADGQKREKQP
ncbi:MAG: MFS transporter [Gammaproteobacteria bacterium]|nr:MFS transporter [Gammaproteobacteria bacterium]